MNKVIILLIIFRDIFLNLISRNRVVLITESAQWSIYDDCKNIQTQLKGVVDIRISLTSFGLRNKIVHFASANTFINKKGLRSLHHSNIVIITWFHVNPTDLSIFKHVPLLNERVTFIHTSCTITRDILVAHGLLDNKIILIPLGVDTRFFTPASAEEKIQIRNELNLPADKIIVGSFQKDGNGWGIGMTPKYVKGPDVFCDVVERLANEHPIHVLLTGPSRGYVKERLRKAGVSYTHRFLSHPNETAYYYKALDFYLISSRAEGGPKALLETMASGVPVVSTKVGMVADVIGDGINGFVADIDDVEQLTQKTMKLLADKSLTKQIIENSLIKIHDFDITKTTRGYYEKMYKQLLEK
jgi:glycosyltransferase involved in cell wall biosynthesis